MNTDTRISHLAPCSTSDKQLVKTQVTLNVGGGMEEEHLFSPLSAGIDRAESKRQTDMSLLNAWLMIGLPCLVAKSFLIPENWPVTPHCYRFKSYLEIWSQVFRTNLIFEEVVIRIVVLFIVTMTTITSYTADPILLSSDQETNHSIEQNVPSMMRVTTVQ